MRIYLIWMCFILANKGQYKSWYGYNVLTPVFEVLIITFCSTEIDNCAIHSACTEGKICISRIGSHDCVCPEGFYGNHCDKGRLFVGSCLTLKLMQEFSKMTRTLAEGFSNTLENLGESTEDIQPLLWANNNRIAPRKLAKKIKCLDSARLRLNVGNNNHLSSLGCIFISEKQAWSQLIKAWLTLSTG